LNTRAVAAQMIVSILLIVVIPNVVPKIAGLAGDEALTVQTRERVVETQLKATQEDVGSGRATIAGELITKRERIAPAGIFFETVVRENADDSTSRLQGRGLFRPQIWALSTLGVDFTSWSKASITTTVSLFDASFPFVLLLIFSRFTRRNSEHVLRDFYARIHTPAVADAELDARLVREKIDNPELVEQDKIFPGTDWEFWRPTTFDVLGFLACVGFVIVIIGLYMVVASIGG
jgi:hypothetical protein